MNQAVAQWAKLLTRDEARADRGEYCEAAGAVAEAVVAVSFLSGGPNLPVLRGCV